MTAKKDRTNELLQDIEAREEAIARLKRRPRTARGRQAVRTLEHEIGVFVTLISWQRANLEAARR